jgi:hypothetical protein
MRQRNRSIFSLLVIPLFIAVSGNAEPDAAEPTARPDLVEIAIAKPDGALDRPPVRFPHDLHTEALSKRGMGCTVCHPARDDGDLSLLFERLGAVPDGALEDLYHDRCIGCHSDTESAGLKSGPVACGDCHRKDPVYTSSLKPYGFDKSLHYRHIKAYKDKCDPCHHIYDEKADKLVYVEGREDPCRDCHRKQTEGNRSSFRVAAHQSCVNCHLKVSSERPDARVGPLTCHGCHDAQSQMAVEVVENPPRLKRGQPDFVLLSAPEDELESSKLNTVPFSHKDHELATNTCRTCHHDRLAACGKCHSLAGKDEGDGVTLQQAMHRTTSDHSCIGCHMEEKFQPQCAGCHDLMEQGRLSEHACTICHSGPPPENLAAAEARPMTMDDFRPAPEQLTLSYAADEIPDTVTVRALSQRYPNVRWPHRKVVLTLSNHISKSKIATHFHGNADVVCQGCHHHGSIDRKQALCENCHGKPFRESALLVPGLKGAYHRQCLGCHLSMGLQTVTNCRVCHGDVDLVDQLTSRLPGEGAE